MAIRFKSRFLNRSSFSKFLTKMASTEDSGFEMGRIAVRKWLLSAVEEGKTTFEGLEESTSFKFPENEQDKKAIFEQAFRDILNEHMIEDKGKDDYEKIISLAIEACKQELCNPVLSVILMADLFDCQTIDKCEQFFEFVENRVDTWKLDLFRNQTKNNLLRMCNDLLRRLSRSQNTVFCGRILLFLAKFFPLSERSGLNIVSEFNLDNVTTFSSKDDCEASSVALDKEEPMEEGEMDDLGNTNPITLDYSLYKKFWSLQDHFRNPNLLYNRFTWKQFISNSSDVLSAFGSFKLDDVKSGKKKLEISRNADKHVYFAKYLTNQKLLDLQLSDSNFRRYVLVQFLILFQYLTASVKFKPDSYVMQEDQLTWIKDSSQLVYQLLEETPPDGAKFARSIQHILQREEHWNSWKNDGCQEFHSKQEEAEKKPSPPHRQRRRLGDEIKNAVANKKFLMGNAELTRLWNLYPDNIEACKSQKRDFLPTLESFFEEAIENQTDLENIEEEKSTYNSNYGWRALRLLSRRSPHFFTSSNQPMRKMPLYLSSMVRKLAKELPQQTAPQDKTDSADKEDVGEANAESEEEFLENSDEKTKDEEADKEDEKSDDVELVTKEQLQSVAKQVGLQWKVLARQLKCEEDEIAYFESENAEIEDQANKMLIVWMEREGDNATPEALIEALNLVNFETIAESVFS